MRDELGSVAVLRLSVRAVQQMSGSFQLDFQSKQFRRYTALKLAELLAEAGDGQA